MSPILLQLYHSDSIVSAAEFSVKSPGYETRGVLELFLLAHHTVTVGVLSSHVRACSLAVIKSETVSVHHATTAGSALSVHHATTAGSALSVHHVVLDDMAAIGTTAGVVDELAVALIITSLR